ncbi:hypothetical protein LIER_38621 [Lithospermum erythrorhizon]|uniref:Uncharacterized protein n=1 Tax=Lithospermum erythrorhizon TaxID=34254 RepID=A0AAV3Q797_LITER
MRTRVSMDVYEHSGSITGSSSSIATSAGSSDFQTSSATNASAVLCEPSHPGLGTPRGVSPGTAPKISSLKRQLESVTIKVAVPVHDTAVPTALNDEDGSAGDHQPGAESI